MDERARLDAALVARGLERTRERAKARIQRGDVRINGVVCQKPARAVAASDEITLAGQALAYVGRGGLKLEKALEHFAVDVAGLCALDVGASTGGFTDCLLRRGARKVYALDVGHGQLAETLRRDERVVCMERMNVRDLTPDSLTEPADIVTVDVSFLSLGHVFAPVHGVVRPGGMLVTLIKPQFEAGPAAVGKNGVVRSAGTHVTVIDAVLAAARDCGFVLRGLTHSPVTGQNGNIEFLAYFARQTEAPSEPFIAAAFDIAALVRQAHQALT